MKSLLIRTKILFTAYLTLARQFWWHRRKSKLNIFNWIIGIVEYVLAILGSLVFISLYPNRSTVVFGIFNWMRSIDDLIDGDNPKAKTTDIKAFIEAKGRILEKALEATIHQHIDGADIFDKGIAYALIQADKLGIGTIVRSHLSTIWDLMIKEKKMFSQLSAKSDLDGFAEKQDKAIGELMCILMGGNVDILDKWWSNRGVFTKIDWIKDLDADLEQGLIHISQETFTAVRTSIQIFLSQSKEAYTQRFICAQFELKEIAKQWKEVLRDRKIFANSFSNPFIRMIFNSIAIGGFDRRVKRLLAQYQVGIE